MMKLLNCVFLSVKGKNQFEQANSSLEFMYHSHLGAHIVFQHLKWKKVSAVIRKFLGKITNLFLVSCENIWSLLYKWKKKSIFFKSPSNLIPI